MQTGIRNKWLCAAASLWLLVGLTSAARAETVTQKLFETTTLVTSTSMNLTEFHLTAPGTLLIELDDLKWPGLLDTLSFTLTDATHTLQTFMLNGTDKGNFTFNVNAPGTLYGAIYAKPNPVFAAGMYYAKVSYQSVAAVPLPAAIWLLISGISGLAVFRPKQKLSQICA